MEFGVGGFIVYGLFLILAPRLGLAIVFLVHADGNVWAYAVGAAAMLSIGEEQIKQKLKDFLDLMFHFLTGRQFIVETEKIVEVEKIVEKVRVREKIVRVPVQTMSTTEAYECLGCKPGDDIRKSYRTMLQKVHPDHGGSPYLTRLVVQARTMLENAK